EGVTDPLVVQHPAGDERPADRSVGPYAQQQADAGDFAAVVDPHGDRLDVQDRHAGARHLQVVGGEPARRGLGHVRHCLIILSTGQGFTATAPYCGTTTAVPDSACHCEQETRPGSIRSRPSKNAAMSAALRAVIGGVAFSFQNSMAGTCSSPPTSASK